MDLNGGMSIHKPFNDQRPPCWLVCQVLQQANTATPFESGVNWLSLMLSGRLPSFEPKGIVLLN